MECAKHNVDPTSNKAAPLHILWMFAQDTPVNRSELGRTAKQAEKKRNQWQQLNDQKTAGIPGICPLYVGMKARVTERIGKKLHINKHSPCTVVGWGLHSGDRLKENAPQRVLMYLPRIVYIEFKRAKWQVEGLPPGGFPLKHQKRQWLLNKTTESWVDRKGFLLIPDHACTARIVQGSNFKAAMADCGDVCDTPPLKDMLAAYVILSRVSTADTLLLLRAFSARLFQHGPPPGPHYLMKLLRSRLQADRDEANYGPQAALDEYEDLQANARKRRGLLKNAEWEWTCFGCQHAYGAVAFEAMPGKQIDIYRKCITPGYWLSCRACAAARTASSEVAAEPQLQECAHCNQEKNNNCFEAKPQWCRACVLKE